METEQEETMAGTDSASVRQGSPEVERGVIHHPLADDTEQESSCTTAASASSSYAAELVQSAAKSLLDTSTSMVSDDESYVGSPSPSPIATLRSLETEKLPALPDEQDRKRFLGCLASILASSYEYDFDLDDLNDLESEQVAASFHFELDDLDDDDEAYESRSQSDLESVSDHFASVPLQRSTSNSFCYEVESNDSGGEQEPQQQTEGSACDLDRAPTPESITQEQMEDDKPPRPGGVTQEQTDDGKPPRPESVTQEHTENGRPPRPESVTQQQTADGVPTRRQSSNPLSISLLRKDKFLAEQARARHRRRRYDMFSSLLLSASDLLFLDKSQAKAFIPMLRSLISPPKKSSEEVKQPATKSGKWLRRASTVDESTSSAQEEDSGYKSDPGALEPSDTLEESMHSRAASNDFDDEDDRYFMLQDLRDSEILRAFLESITPGAGFRCLSLMLLQHLLRSEQGYDARVRHVFKKLGVIVLVHEMEREQYSFGPDGEKIQLLTNAELAELATRKFEALEHGIAAKLIRLSEMQGKQKGRSGRRPNKSATEGSNRQLRRGLSRQQVVRGLKVGSAGLVAGTLFAVTGGLAAPGIAAGIAAIAGSAAATAAVVTLTSTAAVTAIFGVGGGSLAAYKMQRRTKGLTEFCFQKENQPGRIKGREGKGRIEPELFSTICISGWLRDNCDFQRPWGVSPTNPRITDRLELLERFYSVHKPDHVSKCSRILSKWKGEEKELWKLLRKKYGRDPDHLFPIEGGSRLRGSLTLDEDEVLDQLFVDLGHLPDSGFLDEEARSIWKSTFSRRSSARNDEDPSLRGSSATLGDSMRGPRTTSTESNVDGDSGLLSGFENASSSNATKEQKEKEKDPPKHLRTVWDYQATYGGELYTIKWESDLLMEICDSVADMAIEVLENTTRQILKVTALGTLLTAVAIPTVLLSAMNMIDGSWTLAIERSDEAGQELAKSLLFSRAGHRPVTLVGFSMGARVIYSCLKELARYQEKWEDARATHSAKSSRRSKDGRADREDGYVADDKIKVFEGMREPASIVEDVIVMGLPNHLNLNSWVACRQIVGGRLINCYSRKDLILSLMFQSKKITSGLKKVCGTCEIDVPGVENFDVTDLVSGHTDYCLAAGEILKRVRHGQPMRRKQRSEAQASEDDAASAAQTS